MCKFIYHAMIRFIAHMQFNDLHLFTSFHHVATSKIPTSTPNQLHQLHVYQCLRVVMKNHATCNPSKVLDSNNAISCQSTTLLCGSVLYIWHNTLQLLVKFKTLARKSCRCADLFYYGCVKQENAYNVLHIVRILH